MSCLLHCSHDFLQVVLIAFYRQIPQWVEGIVQVNTQDRVSIFTVLDRPDPSILSLLRLLRLLSSLNKNMYTVDIDSFEGQELERVE